MDYYKILGVDKKASADEIKKAYRKLAMRHHPDRNPGDSKSEAEFKKINEAYDTLSSPEKKARYDMGGGTFNNFDFDGFGSSDIFNSVFGDMFGSSFGRAAQKGGGLERGGDLRMSVEFELEEAIVGCEKNIEVNTSKSCDKCSGSGSSDGVMEHCEECHGGGYITRNHGIFSMRQTCRECDGAGSIIKNPCKKCGGNGVLRTNEKIKVNIPAGVDSGNLIKVAGKGEYGRGGNGDLYIEVVVKDHKIFKRSGNDIYCDLNVRLTQAALGCEVNTPKLINSSYSVKIPEGTQSGKLFKIPGKGVKSAINGKVGDMICRLVVETPVNLTSKQKNILKSLEKTFDK